ncbi:MAG: AAA family ATPase [Acidobacteria bacterium]|nr:AAA family ATPase [Acidobacteriota bacterium]
MRFESVRAHPFGPFRDETLDLSPGMNVVYGPNEAGKSTWHAALYAGLCGVRRGPGAGRAEDRRFRDRHRPWDDGGAWAVSARVALADGRRVELRQDLAAKVGSRASDADRAGRDYTAEILHDGAPDGSRWLGLTRGSFLAASSVRQAQILGLLADPGALQEDLQRAAATAGTDETAARALDVLHRHRRERVGSAQSRSRPLPMAQERVREAAAAVERAQEAQGEFRALAARIERTERAARAAEERAAAMRAALAEREAAEAERRAERASELAARFPEGSPRPVAHVGESEQVAAALATWRSCPEPQPPEGRDAESLARELAATDASADGAASAVSPWPVAAAVGVAAGTALALALALADLPVAGSAVAALGFGGLAWWWLAARRRERAAAGASAAAARPERRRWLRARIAHRRDADRRFAEDLERRRRAAAGVRAAADALGLAAADPEAQAASLAAWQGRRRAARADIEGRGAAWDTLQQLLAGQSLEALAAAAEARRADAATRAAEVGGTALDSARAAPVTTETLARSEHSAAVERAAAHTGRGRLEQLAAGLPSLVDAEEELAAARAELERVERLDRTLATTIRFLEQAEERVHRDVAPVLGATVRRWLPQVTATRYADCRVDPESLRIEVRAAGGEWRRAELLSHGTAEQVYLLLRLALARHLAAPGEVCPLILDDAVAACDRERKRALLDTLREISAAAQVILFTHEEDVREWARRNLSAPRDRLTALGRPAAV